jgi:hypothetical protein
METKETPLDAMATDLHFVQTVRNDPVANEASYAALSAVTELVAASDRLQLAYALMDLDPDFIRLRKALAIFGIETK